MTLWVTDYLKSKINQRHDRCGGPDDGLERTVQPMGLARRSEDEQERLAELRSFRILDTGREPAFDEVVELLAAQLDMSVALISLVDEDR